MNTQLETVVAIEATYRARREMQGIKPGSAKDHKAQVEFFCGAMSALEATQAGFSPPPSWCIKIMSGRLIVEA